MTHTPQRPRLSPSALPSNTPPALASLPLRPIEQAFLSFDAAHPTMSLGCGGLALFRGTAPTIEEVREQFARHVGVFPRMLCLLAGQTPGRARWSPAAAADVTALIHEQVTPPGGRAALHHLVDELLSAPFPRDRPLWQVRLVHGYAPDEFALLYLAHHVLQDGVSVTAVGDAVLGADTHTYQIAPAHRSAPDGAPSRRATLRAIRKSVQAFLPLVPPGPRTPLSGDRRLSWADAPADTLHCIADRHHATVNDVYLAALTGLLRAWPQSPWRALANDRSPLWTLVPMSTRHSSDTAPGGIRVAGFRLPLPCHQPRALHRLQTIRRLTAHAKGKGIVTAERAVAAGTPLFIARAALSLTMSTRSAHLMASNITWPDRPLALAGRPLIGGVPITFLPPGHRFSATLSTHQDRVCVGFITDRLLAGTGDLPGLWLSALDELDHA